jgi:hypothetical protein
LSLWVALVPAPSHAASIAASAPVDWLSMPRPATVVVETTPAGISSQGPVDLAITSIQRYGPIEAGRIAAYRITIENRGTGPGAATTLVVKDNDDLPFDRGYPRNRYTTVEVPPLGPGSSTTVFTVVPRFGQYIWECSDGPRETVIEAIVDPWQQMYDSDRANNTRIEVC